MKSFSDLCLSRVKWLIIWKGMSHNILVIDNCNIFFYRTPARSGSEAQVLHCKEPISYIRKAQVQYKSWGSQFILNCYMGITGQNCFFKWLINTISSNFILYQANWEKRIVKSINSMCTELNLPLSRKVSYCLMQLCSLAIVKMYLHNCLYLPITSHTSRYFWP